MKALPRMAKAAESQELKQAFLHHRDETEGQIERVQKAFEAFGKSARGTTCEAINGLIEEGEDVIGGFDMGPVRDAAMIACAQAIEHYEIARYGALIAWCKGSGHREIVNLLEQTLEQEKKADSLLNQLANEDVNRKATHKAA